MKKKLLSTLLCAAMALGTLAGCGAKETTSDNVVVETEENVENEATTNEEVEVENENNDIVVDAERPEGMIVGETNYTDWGSYTVVDSANGLDNIEVEFYGQAFKATVPQDMGAVSAYNGSNAIELYNETESKMLKVWYTTTSLDDKENDDKITEEQMKSYLKNSTYEEDYFYNKEWVNNNLSKFTFEANVILPNGIETHGYAVFMSDYEKGLCYQFYYGEATDICDMNVVKTVANSLDFLPFEELTVLNNINVSNVNSDGSLDQDVLNKYGISNSDLSLTTDSIITDNNNMLSISTSNLTIDSVNKIINDCTTTTEVYDMTGNKISSPINLTLQDDVAYQALYYKNGDIWNEISFSFINIGNVGNLNISIKKDFPVMF